MRQNNTTQVASNTNGLFGPQDPECFLGQPGPYGFGEGPLGAANNGVAVGPAALGGNNIFLPVPGPVPVGAAAALWHNERVAERGVVHLVCNRGAVWGQPNDGIVYEVQECEAYLFFELPRYNFDPRHANGVWPDESAICP